MSGSFDLGGGFDVETPEQVSFRLVRAGLGSRILAASVDTVILVVVYVFVVIGLFGAGAALAAAGSELVAWHIAVVILVLTFLLWGYYIGFELAWNGQTPGKRLLGIRVVGDGGIPVTPSQVVVRNLIRVVDLQFGYGVAMIAMFATKDEKRLGDLAAGTVVVSERRRAPDAPPRGAATAAGRALDPELLDVLRDYWARSSELDEETRERIARSLAKRLAAALGRPATNPRGAEAELREMTDLVLGRPDR
jgi:uncharacterized RDD family membrane protein YckC